MSDPARSTFRTWWLREHYTPSLLGLLVNPFYFARHGLARALAPRLGAWHGEVLDVGCGCKPYREFVPASRYVGLDIDTPFTRQVGIADAFYDGGVFPFTDGSFDAVLCSQVLEHVFEPEAFLREIRRVLRPGGQLLLAVPFMWDEHEQPRDYGRYSSFGLRALLARSGFEVLVLEKTVADAGAVAQLASAWIFKLVHARNRWVNLAAQLVCIAPVNLIGAGARLILPRNEDFYLDNVVLAQKSPERELPAHYQKASDPRPLPGPR